MTVASEFVSAMSQGTSDGEEAAPSAEALNAITAILSEIAGRYSMAQEREVHRRHVPGGAELDVPVEDACDGLFGDDDDDDDGLF